MTINHPLKSPSVQLLLILYLLSLAFILGMAWPWPRDPDIGWHLKTGEWILSYHTVPWADPFGANTAGVQWIAYSWLAELLFYGIERTHPLVGLHLLQAFVFSITAGILLLHALVRSGSFRAALVLTPLFFIPMYPSWLARPQIFSFMFTALTMLILWWGLHRNSRVLWSLPLLIIVWANIHVYFIVGIGLIALHLMEAGTKRPEQKHSYIFLLLLCILAPLLNPYGIHLYEEIYLLAKHASEGWGADAIEELASPNFHDGPMNIFLMWIFLACAILILSRKKPTLLTLFLFLGFLYQALQHVRDTPYFVIIMLPILADHLTRLPWPQWQNFFLQGVSPSWPRLSTSKGLIHWVAACGVIPIILILPYRMMNYPEQVKKAYFQNDMTGAAEYLLQARPPGPLFNAFEWGSYYIYTLAPVYKVYGDGRSQLYNRQFWETYDRIRRGKSDWEKRLDNSGVRAVIWKKNTVLASLLSLSPNWTLAWSDDHAVIYVKRPSGPS